MKKIAFLLLLFALVSTAPAFAQKKPKEPKAGNGGAMPKEEEKAWQNKYKDFAAKYKKDIPGFRDFIETAEANAASASRLEGEVTRLNDKQKKQADEIDNLRTERGTLQQKVVDLESKVAGGNSKPSTPSTGGIPSKGTVFTIQIGSFEKIPRVSGGASTNFVAEPSGNATKYMVGIFDKYDDAIMMRDALKKMGVKDAWIVAYKDGQRVDVKDVVPNAK